MKTIYDNAGASDAEPLVKRGYLFLEDSDWNKADEYFDGSRQGDWHPWL